MGIFGLVATRNAISYQSDYSTYFDRIVYVPLWRFFLDVTKVPNLCSSLSKEGYGGGMEKFIEQERERYKVIRHVILARREGVLSIPPMENGDPPD